jgi:hypothetical protein
MTPEERRAHNNRLQILRRSRIRAETPEERLQRLRRSRIRAEQARARRLAIILATKPKPFSMFDGLPPVRLPQNKPWRRLDGFDDGVSL